MLYASLERPMNTNLPDSIWNLLGIVQELFQRKDGNSVHLLRVITALVLDNTLIVVWWFKTMLSAAYLDYRECSNVLQPRPAHFST